MKIFINENLTQKNKAIAFEGTKLKRKGIISAYYIRNGVVYLKKTEHSKTKKFTICMNSANYS